MLKQYGYLLILLLHYTRTTCTCSLHIASVPGFPRSVRVFMRQTLAWDDSSRESRTVVGQSLAHDPWSRCHAGMARNFLDIRLFLLAVSGREWRRRTSFDWKNLFLSGRETVIGCKPPHVRQAFVIDYGDAEAYQAKIR